MIMKKFLIIKDTNKIIYFKNRQIRTPATLKVTDNDLKTLHTALRMADIQNFEITTDDPIKIIKDEIFVEENKEVIIEELEEKEEPSTILEELMRNGEKK
jgi:hypothetical protein